MWIPQLLRLNQCVLESWKVKPFVSNDVLIHQLPPNHFCSIRSRRHVRMAAPYSSKSSPRRVSAVSLYRS